MCSMAPDKCDCVVCGTERDTSEFDLCFETIRNPHDVEQVGYCCPDCFDDARVRPYNRMEVA